MKIEYNSCRMWLLSYSSYWRNDKKKISLTEVREVDKIEHHKQKVHQSQRSNICKVEFSSDNFQRLFYYLHS